MNTLVHVYFTSSLHISANTNKHMGYMMSNNYEYESTMFTKSSTGPGNEATDTCYRADQ